MRWTRYPSHSAAVRALDSAVGGDGGLRRGMIERLVNGDRPHFNGFEARRCDGQHDDDDDDGGGGDDDDGQACARDSSPPFFAALVTKPVVVRGRGGSPKLPKWFVAQQSADMVDVHGRRAKAHAAHTRARPRRTQRAKGSWNRFPVEVRRFDPRTGALVRPWTRYASQTAAAGALRKYGLNDTVISKLVRGAQPHHDGFEARRCGGQHEEGGEEKEEDNADQKPGVRDVSPPFFEAMVTKPVTVGWRVSSEAGRDGGLDNAPPTWFKQRPLAVAEEPHAEHGAPWNRTQVEARRFDPRTGALVRTWTRYASQTAAAGALRKHGLNDTVISKLVRGVKPHHDGWEVRCCGRPVDGDGVSDGSDDQDGAEVDADAPPSWFRPEQQPGMLGRTTSHSRSNAVEVRAPKHATEHLRGKVGTVPSTSARETKTIFSCVPAAA